VTWRAALAQDHGGVLVLRLLAIVVIVLLAIFALDAGPRPAGG
jgi:hypothetical protein